MKPLFLVLSLIVILPFASMAEGKVDSLMQRATMTFGEEKAKICLELIGALKFSDQEKAKEYGNVGLAIAQKLGLKNLEPRLLLNLGVVNAIQANYPTSIEYYEKALKLFKETDNAKGVGHAHSNMGMTYRRLGDYDEAMKAYEKAMLLFQTLEDTSTVLLIKGNMANLDYKRGNYDAALVVYEEILEWALKHDSKASIARYFGNIGRVLFRTGDYPASLSNYYKALPILDSLDNKTELLNMYNNIGIIYSDLEMHERAIEYFEKGLMLSDSMGNMSRVGAIYSNLSRRYTKKNNYDKAYMYIQKALSVYDDIGVKSKGSLLQNLAIIYKERAQYDSAEITLNQGVAIGLELEQENILAGCYANFGELYFDQNEFEKAKDYLLQSEVIYEKVGDVKGLNSVVKTLAKVFEATNELKKALTYKEKNSILTDSLFGLEQMDKIIRLQLEQERQTFLQLELEEIKKGTYFQPILWIIPFILGLIGIGFYLFVRKRKEAETDLQATLNQVAAENEAMKDSLNQKNLEMTFLSLDMVQKDDFLQKLKAELERFAKKVPENKEVRQLIRSVHFQDAGKKDWATFKQAYEQVFPLFFDTLLHDYPTLSSRELRHCALIRLKIPLQEVAEISGISVNSVHKARHRLRTKFQMSRSEKLESFISKY